MSAEYYIARTHELPRSMQKTSSVNKEAFTVTKFEGNEVPEAVYLVIWDKRTDRMLCECPNKRRSAHVDDKHGQLVREWIAAGEPQRAFKGKPQSRKQFSRPLLDTESESPDDDIPF